MAGIVISQAAENIPAQIKKLVYLAAYLPVDRERLISLAPTDDDAHVDKYQQIDQATGSANIAKEGIVDEIVANSPNQFRNR